MKFLSEYKQPILTYTRVTKKATVDHKTKRIQLREDRHIFELALPNIVSGIRDMADRFRSKFYDAVGRLLVPTCYAA